LILEKTALIEKCRKTEPIDYVVTLSLYCGDQILRNWLENEKQKPLDQRNNVWILLGEICSIGADYLIHEVNKDLCNPLA
jgi:hypothetical protein